MLKKDLQKYAKKQRDQQLKDWPETWAPEYPKAMMTQVQQQKRTATINCGDGVKRSDDISGKILNDPEFLEILKGAAAVKETRKNWYGDTVYQIRINY